MGVRTANVQPGNIGETLTGLAEVIHGRRDASPQESYTARLLTDGEDELLKKLAAEASEVIMACKDNDHDHIRYEAGDLIYHLLVTLERYGITLDELAQVAALSPYHFQRQFKAHYHVTPHQMLMAIRLWRAKAFLTHGMPAAEVAIAVGLTDQSHLTRAFTQRYGITPVRYQKQVARR